MRLTTSCNYLISDHHQGNAEGEGKYVSMYICGITWDVSIPYTMKAELAQGLPPIIQKGLM